MREIGGYIEIDRYDLPMLHDEATALNCGRNCLAYLLRARHIKIIWLPRLLGTSISELCKREGVVIKYYSIDMSFVPLNVDLTSNEWIYIVNYYGQLSNEKLQEIKAKYERVIVDQAQAYFQKPIKGIDTIYICRKFLGVPDGAFVYTNILLDEKIEQDESYGRMKFLCGRYEKTASEFYDEFLKNEEQFGNESIKKMSKLTINMLHGINYKTIKERRTRNFTYLHEHLKKMNKLKVVIPVGAFMYPLYIVNGIEIRKRLQNEKIYIPIFWSNVLNECKEKELEYDMACNILPLPVDQRYDYTEMEIIISYIEKFSR